MKKLSVCLSAGLAAVVVGNLWFLQLTGPSPDFDFYQENGVLENVQVVLLILCCGVLAAQYVNTGGSSRRLVLLTGLLLSFTFLIRECDLRPYGAPQLITYFTDGAGRYPLLVPSWLILLVALVRDRPARRWMARRLPLSPTGFLLLASAILLGVGVLFDKSVLQMIPSRFYEELFELNGYFLLLVAALVFGQSRRRVARLRRRCGTGEQVSHL